MHDASLTWWWAQGWATVIITDSVFPSKVTEYVIQSRLGLWVPFREKEAFASKLPIMKTQLDSFCEQHKVDTDMEKVWEHVAALSDKWHKDFGVKTIYNTNEEQQQKLKTVKDIDFRCWYILFDDQWSKKQQKQIASTEEMKALETALNGNHE